MDRATKKHLHGAFKRQKKRGKVSPFDKHSIPDIIAEFADQPFVKRPEDLTVVSIVQLGKLFSRLSAWLNYVNQKVAIAKIKYNKLKSNYGALKARKLFVATGQFKAKQFASVRISPEVSELRSKLLYADAELIALNSFVWGIKQDLEAIRFELNRRRYEENSAEK